jgi:hypothetical protein
MKMIRRWLGVLTLLATVCGLRAAVGYVNFTFEPGDNLFGNPLYNPPHLLSSLITSAPTGTTVSLWNSTSRAFTTTSTWNGSTWSDNLTLDPGTGALLHTPSMFETTFAGTVLNFDGSVYTGNLTEPPAFSGANGIYLLASRAPVALSGHVFDPVASEYSVFEALIGRAPHDGEQVTTLDPLTQAYTTTTFINGAWNNGDPTLGVGEAAFVNIGAVPEPTAIGLFAAGLGVWVLRRRQMRSS